MAVATTLAQLEEVQAAITKVLKGQSFRAGDITYTRADLSALQARESVLLARYNREQRGSARTRIDMSKAFD